MNEWQWWQSALAGGNPDIHADTPQCGFFKMRDGKDGAWLPVMIRFDDGALRARVGDNSDADPYKIWTFCAGRPISKEDAAHAFKTGHFPGDVPAIGDNSGDLSLAEQITDYVASAIDWLRKVGVKDTASKNMAANYRAELLRLCKEAETQHDVEKRPHMEAGRAIDAKFKPLISEATIAAAQLRDALTDYMTAEKRALEAEQRLKWEAEQRAATIARAEIEAQRAKLMWDDPIAALTSPEPEMPPMPPPPAAVKIQAGGQRGRKTGLREITRYRIDDYDAVLATVKDHADVRSAVEKVAASLAKAGAKVPGLVSFTEEIAA